MREQVRIDLDDRADHCEGPIGAELGHVSHHAVVDAFIDDRLEITGDPKDVTSIHKLYTEYVLWYVENQPARTETWHNETRQRPVDPLSGVEFGRRLTTRGVGTTVLPFVIGAEKVHARTGVRFK